MENLWIASVFSPLWSVMLADCKQWSSNAVIAAAVLGNGLGTGLLLEQPGLDLSCQLDYLTFLCPTLSGK